ncbi:MAG: PDZ domain-containing protein, partial [Bacteroidales bacterium]|nr:PDZ domain-containing protein [Bacteroidales bacterium]
MSEEYHNNKSNRLLPIFFAIVLAAGFASGYWLSLKQQVTQGIHIQSDKIKELQSLIKTYYFDTINNTQLTDNAIKAILSELDPHSSYMTKAETQQFETTMKGGIEGIGIQFNIINDTVVVMSITNDGPAEKTGILPGDKIIEVDTTKIAGIKIQNNDVIQKIRGKKGSTVK